MDTSSLYNVELKWEEGRKGHVSSPIPDSTIEVATPPEFPNGVPGIWSPEHLLVAAVNSCLMTTFLAIPEDKEKGLKILQKSEAAYLISNSVRYRIIFIPEIKIQQNTKK